VTKLAVSGQPLMAASGQIPMAANTSAMPCTMTFYDSDILPRLTKFAGSSGFRVGVSGALAG
jgi:hypothetical protein